MPKNNLTQNGYPLFKLTAIAALLAGAMPLSALAEAQRFNIPAQSLDNALTELADSANLKLLYPVEMVKNQKSQPLSGSYSPQQALQQMLAGTGITAKSGSNGALVLAKNDVAFDVADNKNTSKNETQTTTKITTEEPTLLETVNVIDKAKRDINAPDNKDYKISNAVTATKTDTPIMETPMSVKIVPQQVMKDQQVITLDQALRNVSGAVSGAGGSGTFFLRGFGNYNIYRDGFLNQSQWAHTEDLTNVERVEVLKGPASILYGRSEPGGLVNFVTKQPLDTPYYSLRQQFGSFNHYRTNVDVGGPLTENKDLAYRFNLGYQTNNTFQEFGGDERLFVAPTIRWKISDKTTSTLRLEYSDIKEKGRGTVPLQGNHPADIPRSRNLGDPWNIQEDEYVMVSLNTEHAFNDKWKLQHRFNFSDYTLTMSGQYPTGSGIPIAANGNKRRFFFAQNIDGNDYQHNFFNALELTGKFNTGVAKHTLLLGGDYYHAEYRATSAGFTFPLSDLTNIYNPIHKAAPPVLTPADISTQSFTLPWFGLYAQDQIELPYNIHVLAGFRYDNASTSGTIAGNVATDTNYDRISPRGGVVWQPIPELSLYGSYTENFGAANNFWTNEPLPPQTAQQWEIGAKTELFDNRFSATLAYFDLTKQNIPITMSNFITRAAGEQQSKGLELDLSGEILPGWNVIGAYAYTPFAKTMKDSDGAGTEGKRLNNAPRNSGSLWTTYEFQEPMLHNLKLGAGIQSVGKREIGYNNTAQAAGYTTVGLMASQLWNVGKAKVTAQLNVDNLLDKTYTASIYSYGPTLYGAPRSFMGSLKIEY